MTVLNLKNSNPPIILNEESFVSLSWNLLSLAHAEYIIEQKFLVSYPIFLNENRILSPSLFSFTVRSTGSKSGT